MLPSLKSVYKWVCIQSSIIIIIINLYTAGSSTKMLTGTESLCYCFMNHSQINLVILDSKQILQATRKTC